MFPIACSESSVYALPVWHVLIKQSHLFPCRRVDWGSCPPQPLADPDGSNSDIRLFNNSASLRHSRCPYDAHGWQRVALADALELLPAHPLALRAAVQPLAP